MLRAAEPDPRRARTDNSRGLKSSPAAFVAASASAANPEAEDASPAPVGKSFSVITRARAVMPARARHVHKLRHARKLVPPRAASFVALHRVLCYGGAEFYTR